MNNWNNDSFQESLTPQIYYEYEFNLYSHEAIDVVLKLYLF
jgi:hypothetical protein